MQAHVTTSLIILIYFDIEPFGLGGSAFETQGLMWLSVTTPCFSGFWYVFRRTINLVSLVHCKTYHFYEQQVPGRCTGLTGLIWGPGRAKRRGGACGQDVWWKICIGTQRTNSMRQKSPTYTYCLKAPTVSVLWLAITCYSRGVLLLHTFLKNSATPTPEGCWPHVSLEMGDMTFPLLQKKTSGISKHPARGHPLSLSSRRCWNVQNVWDQDSVRTCQNHP
jgi:hypothetical protein